jgi:hypothetical protein
MQFIDSLLDIGNRLEGVVSILPKLSLVKCYAVFTYAYIWQVGNGTRDESMGNLQHISEREPDDWEEDPSLHPTTETIFMEKSKQSIK